MADGGLTPPQRSVLGSAVAAFRARWWLQVLAVFAASRAVTTVILLVFASQQEANRWTAAAPGYQEFAMIWDAVWYQWIAVAGYPTELPLGDDGHVTENAWAFLPLYPALVRLLMLVTGVPFPPLAIALSIGCAAGAALLFHRLMARVLPHGALYATALFCFGPVSPILQVAYAESLQLLLLFFALHLLLDRRYLTIVPVMALLAFTRPGALAFALALGLHAIQRFLARRTDPFPPRELAALVVTGLATAVLGFAWLVVAGIATGEPNAYIETELAWRQGYIGYQHLVPFQSWFLGAHYWLWVLGLPDLAAWIVGGAAVLLLAAGFAVFLLSPPARRLGTELRFWLASYALYLLAVFFPQSSSFRLLMPLAPALGALALPRSRVYRAALLLLGVLGQIGWTYICWFIIGSDWSPP